MIEEKKGREWTMRKGSHGIRRKIKSEKRFSIRADDHRIGKNISDAVLEEITEAQSQGPDHRQLVESFLNFLLGLIVRAFHLHELVAFEAELAMKVDGKNQPVDAEAIALAYVLRLARSSCIPGYRIPALDLSQNIGNHFTTISVKIGYKFISIESRKCGKKYVLKLTCPSQAAGGILRIWDQILRVRLQ